MSVTKDQMGPMIPRSIRYGVCDSHSVAGAEFEVSAALVACADEVLGVSDGWMRILDGVVKAAVYEVVKFARAGAQHKKGKLSVSFDSVKSAIFARERKEAAMVAKYVDKINRLTADLGLSQSTEAGAVSSLMAAKDELAELRKQHGKLVKEYEALKAKRAAKAAPVVAERKGPDPIALIAALTTICSAMCVAVWWSWIGGRLTVALFAEKWRLVNWEYKK